MAEYFDLYDEQGRALSSAKERARVHRDGDWHRSIQLWIVRRDARLVFQQRSSDKDTWPDRLTASVSGHYAAGESLKGVLREAQEEIGRDVALADLLPLGLWRSDDRPAPGVIDRELQDVFFWPLEAPLDTLRPDPAEVSALMDVPAAALLALLGGSLDEVLVPCLRVGSAAISTIALVAESFVPAADYHARIARAALAYSAGEPPSLAG